MRNTHRICCTVAALAVAACTRAPAPAEAAASAADAPAAAAAASASTAAMSDADLLAQGEYLVRIAGCNDCHTPDYMNNAGTTPKERWLTGTGLGWNGPWGTTYAPNLRLRLQEMDESAWLAFSASLHTRPPMPDFALRAMKEQDRRAIYRFIRSLGAAGQPAPAYLPPGQTPPVPFMEFHAPPAPAAAPPTPGAAPPAAPGATPPTG